MFADGLPIARRIRPGVGRAIPRPGTQFEFLSKDVTMKIFKSLLLTAVVVAGTVVWAASPER